MTYTKYIDLNLCCFIPGKIIDEVLNVLKLVASTTKPLRAHEVLQELRDISSMAIDHFDEKIAPVLKKSFCDISSQKFGSTIYQSKCLNYIAHAYRANIQKYFISVMQSPIETALVMPSDFGADMLDPRNTSREEQTPCQDAQNNRLAIIRMDRKYEKILKMVKVLTKS